MKKILVFPDKYAIMGASEQTIVNTETEGILYKVYKVQEHILYEDASVIVCIKPAGIAVQTKRMGEQDMESLLRNYLAAKGESPYIGIIHRLDQPVEGVMVYGKTKEATAELNRQMQKNGFGKYYLTVVYGKAEPQEGELIDFLKKDGRNNTSQVVEKKTSEAKRAALTYRVLEYASDRKVSLLEVKLETGRHHQIRVQMSHHGWPLAGDRKYGKKEISDERNRVPLALCSYRLEFVHPENGKKMQFQIIPQGQAFGWFYNLDT